MSMTEVEKLTADMAALDVDLAKAEAALREEVAKNDLSADGLDRRTRGRTLIDALRMNRAALETELCAARMRELDAEAARCRDAIPEARAKLHEVRDATAKKLKPRFGYKNCPIAFAEIVLAAKETHDARQKYLAAVSASHAADSRAEAFRRTNIAPTPVRPDADTIICPKCGGQTKLRHGNRRCGSCNEILVS